MRVYGLRGCDEHLVVLLEPRVHRVPVEANVIAQLLDRRLARTATRRRRVRRRPTRTVKCARHRGSANASPCSVGTSRSVRTSASGQVVRRVARALPHVQRRASCRRSRRRRRRRGRVWRRARSGSATPWAGRSHATGQPARRLRIAGACKLRRDRREARSGRGVAQLCLACPRSASAEPRRADVLHPGQEDVRHRVGRPPRRRPRSASSARRRRACNNNSSTRSPSGSTCPRTSATAAGSACGSTARSTGTRSSRSCVDAYRWCSTKLIAQIGNR